MVGKKGFTLIELILVVAIIGILAAVTLTYLADARGKGKDSKVKSQVVQVRSAIEIYFSNNGNYGPPVTGLEPEGASVGRGCASNIFGNATLANSLARTNLPITAYLNSICTTDGSAYAISIGLSNTGQYWCIDSAGSSRLTNALHVNNRCP